MSEHLETISSVLDLLDDPRCRYLIVGGAIILSMAFAGLAGWFIFYPTNIKN